ncbi:MAG: M48 family metallopeptidase [Burkholderiales bacterium]|nr:M48 family metallopeptidase [Burkholderiales bacterium]
MKHTVRLLGQETSYTLKRSSRRTVGLRIDTQGLTVSTPLRMPEKTIENILHEKSAWILKKLEELRSKPAPLQNWGEGEAVPFLGKNYILRISMADRTRIGTGEGFLEVALPDPEPSKIGAAVESWYKRRARAHFAERIAHYCPMLEVKLPRLFLSSAKTRWGSCNSKREIRLNWRLIRISPDLIDYVVAHELAHLIEMNHSAAFWNTVGKIYPEYRTARATLKRSHHPMC